MDQDEAVYMEYEVQQRGFSGAWGAISAPARFESYGDAVARAASRGRIAPARVVRIETGEVVADAYAITTPRRRARRADAGAF